MRYHDWPERLHRFIHSRQSEAFAWGTNDCCVFAADAIQAITGIDHAADLRGTYTDEASARKILKKRRGVHGIASAALGDEIPPAMAQRGDIVMFTSVLGDTLSVCVGAACAVPGVEALKFAPLRDAVTAWRVK